ncbi:hypothetical protein CPLU01_04584 [Colletotrichum plurivorum]|uniref:Transmembrane protein n=1 Tax=Colletotrichum plurivorum TaxID=2175906 RepID=A0A8H6KNR1_9PEZI|nr:hypothetical protein CPLU01_04584 [Colletotrichum plurivorum]
MTAPCLLESDVRGKRFVSLSLAVTTTLSLVLIIANFQRWNFDGIWYESSLADLFPNAQLLENTLAVFGFPTSKRALFEAASSFVAYGLGFLQVTKILILNRKDILFNLIENATSSIKEPSGYGAPKPRRSVRTRFFASIATFFCLAMLSASLWLGAMKPSSSTIVVKDTIGVPSYSNMTFIKEYPLSQPGPSSTTKNGIFSYSVATTFLNGLVASGSSLSDLPDGVIRKHPKLDNTQFSFEGRSYGVGSSVGILDDALKKLPSARTYSFHEVGYMTYVDCQYNRSMDFHIASEYPHRTFAVTGFFPDSVGSAQWSEYIGQDSSSIVAMGVADSPESPRRYISIAAGEKYKALNATQCTIDFTPVLFQVSVNIRDKSIKVKPLRRVDDFEPTRVLARTTVRQFDLVSNSLMSFHGSVLGDAFLASVAAWNSSMNRLGLNPEADSTLLGVQHSITSMADSILSAYGAAQLVVGNFSQSTTAEVEVDVFVVGNRACVYAVAIQNFWILLLFIRFAMKSRKAH